MYNYRLITVIMDVGCSEPLKVLNYFNENETIYQENVEAIDMIK